MPSVEVSTSSVGKEKLRTGKVTETSDYHRRSDIRVPLSHPGRVSDNAIGPDGSPDGRREDKGGWDSVVPAP